MAEDKTTEEVLNEEETPVEPEPIEKVTIKIIHEESNGKLIKEDSATGDKGTEYTIELEKLKGYTLSSPREAVKGVYGEGVDEIKFIYEPNMLTDVTFNQFDEHLKTMEDSIIVVTTTVPKTDIYNEENLVTNFSLSNQESDIKIEPLGPNSVEVSTQRPGIEGIRQGSSKLIISSGYTDNKKAFTPIVTKEVEITYELVPTSIKAGESKIEMVTGEKIDSDIFVLPFEVLPKRKNIEYSIDNEEIATIDSEGVITAIKEGVTILTAKETNQNLVTEVNIIVTEKVKKGTNEFTCVNCKRTIVGDSFIVRNLKGRRYIICPYDGNVIHENKE